MEWVGTRSRPLNSPGATSSLPQSPSSVSPHEHASQQVPGQPRQGGRESAAHFGLEGESHKSMKAKWEVGTEDLPRQPAPTCHLPGQLGTSWPDPPDRPQEPASSPPPQASVTPGQGVGSQLGHKAKGSLGRRQGCNSPLDPWHIHSRNERKGREVLVPQGGALLTLQPSPGCLGPNPSALWVPKDRTHTVTVRRLLLRQWPV